MFFRRYNKLLHQLNSLEEWLKNVSHIQNQLLKELGYEVKWHHPFKTNVYLQKEDSEEPK